MLSMPPTQKNLSIWLHKQGTANEVTLRFSTNTMWYVMAFCWSRPILEVFLDEWKRLSNIMANVVVMIIHQHYIIHRFIDRLKYMMWQFKSILTIYAKNILDFYLPSDLRYVLWCRVKIKKWFIGSFCISLSSDKTYLV